MTDARLPEHWLYDPEFDALSDRAWRTWTGVLMWCNGQGTDGWIPTNMLRMVYALGVDNDTADELVAAKKWERREGGFQVMGWEKSQSLAADVEWQRERNRMKNAALRARNREEREGVTGHVTGDMTEDVTEVMTDPRGGQDRTGKDAVMTELKLAGTGKRQTKMAAVPTLSSASSCSGCQREVAFGTPCPTHRSETA